jgi:hypothetical protein
MQLLLQFVIPSVSDRIEDDYVELSIERDEGAGFVEISRETTRPPLRDVVERYVYQDPTGDEGWSYQAVLLKADGTPYGTPYAADLVARNTYTTLQAVRDEGVSALVVSDARVEEYIEIANRYIESVTQNWFNPRFQVFELSGENRPRFFFNTPVIALQRVTVNQQDAQIGNLEVNNRYLRNGLTSPDDRKNPMMTFSDGYLVDEGERLYSLGGGYFPKDRQQTKAWGIFGFTELPRGTVCGETSTGSQVPLDYGSVPALIEWCATTIAVNRCFPKLSDEAIQIITANRITKLKTRDQAVEFGDPDASEIQTTTGFTLSKAVDQILATFKRPIEMKFV